MNSTPKKICLILECNNVLGHRNKWGFCKDHEEHKRRAYYDMHKDRMQEYGRQHYADNRQDILAYVNQYRAENKDLLAEKRKQLRRGDKKKYLERESKNAWYQFKQKSAARKKESELSREFYENLITLPCHYCGAVRPSTSLSLWIDRLDNSKGYLVDNVAPCCPKCNKIKGNLLLETEMLEIIKILKKLRSKDDIWEPK